MIPILLLGGAAALVILAAVVVNGAAHSTAQGEFRVAGFAYEEIKNADGSITVVTPELDELVRQRHENIDETDPELQRWFLAEMETWRGAMQRSFDDEQIEDVIDEETADSEVHWHGE